MSAPTFDLLLRRGADRLCNAGLDAPMFEARRLLAAAGGLALEDIIREGPSPAPAELTARFDAFVSRRVRREPLQHIVGRTVFHGLDLICDDRALIPRPDSEVLVDLVLDLLPREAARIADLGVGSGCLLLAVLAARPGDTGVGIDISYDAAALAAENAIATGLQNRATIEVSDWADWTGWAEVDLVLSNPPYVRGGEIDALQPEVRDHDPRGALDGGSDGLDAYRVLVANAAAQGTPGLWLALEIGNDQARPVLDLLAAAGFDNAVLHKDFEGRDRAVAARLVG